MKGSPRLRRLLPYLAFTALALTLVACTGETTQYPNSTFEPKTELGRAIDDLWDILLLLGTIVFVLVELVLLFVVLKYRNNKEAKHTHGNTKLEILWTLIPAVILVFIAVPTVRTIFETQAPAPADALKIDVIGHQWWWEFRYPEQGIVTANELYIPVGRTVNFSLATKDVIHSFWIPQMGAKRDLISNRTNHVWFTPDTAIAPSVWNGFCTEYCGTSHSFMRFRVFTVTPEQFESWIAGQKATAAFNVGPAAPTPSVADSQPQAPTQLAAGVAPGYFFPHESMPAYAVPQRAVPANISFTSGLQGDPARGQTAFMMGGCIGCHTVRGNPMAVGILGPDLTHFATRHTLAGGIYPNTTDYLARWIKNARVMKPGSLMPTLGKGEYDPVLKRTAPVSLDDQQIADIVAYLQQLR
ncbi:MAG: cytochrome c oxidase subunit II [Gemmatimonadaceae bacterium]